METEGAFRGVRVLIVEDETLLAEEIRERLARLGLSIVDVVDTGEQAINRARDTMPDLILMDIRLKGPMTGIDAAKEIRQAGRSPIIYLTAHFDGETRQRALESQPYGYIVKPFQERDLIIAIELALKRYELERQLAEREHWYQATLNSIGDGVVAIDPEGKVTFLNRVATQLTNWNDGDAQGRHVDEVLPLVAEESGKALPSPALEAMNKRRIVHLEQSTLLVNRSAESLPIDDSAAPIVTADGRLLGSVIAFRDVRESRAAAQALKHTEDQLRQALKMESIGRLAGGIAHDFNNFLTVIIGTTDLVLTSSNIDSSTRALLNEVRTAGEKASDLTRQLLAFGRKQVLRPVAIELELLVNRTVRMLDRLIGENIRIQTTIGNSDLLVYADPGQIEQVLFNIVINARDAMPQGGTITIDVRTIRELPWQPDDIAPEALQPAVLISITDTGTGMDRETLLRAFEPFFTTKEVGRGTGLGLATVYGIVKQSGGAIRILSELGRGTEVQVCFPAHQRASPAPVPTTSARPPRGNETIVLVEDHDAVRLMLGTALKQFGYQVHPARDAVEAIQLMSQLGDRVHLIVTDVIMPGTSGRELVEQVRRSRPGIKALFVSGYTDDEIVRQGIIQGEVHFLQKPISPDVLARKVRDVLDGK